MSFTNGDLSWKFSHEMKEIGYLVLSLLRNDHPEEALSHFLGMHTRLVQYLTSKLDQTNSNSSMELANRLDLTIELQKLNQLQHIIESGILTTTITRMNMYNNEGLFSKEIEDTITKLAGNPEEMTESGIEEWYYHIIDNMSWVLLQMEMQPTKITRKIMCLCKIIKGIELRVNQLQSSDKKTDLLIIWKNCKLLFSFLYTLSSMMRKKTETDSTMMNQGKKKRSSTKKKNHHNNM